MESPLFEQELSAAEHIEGEDDIEALFRATGPDPQLKGMFFKPLQSALGTEFKALVPMLTKPPRRGYVPFVDYPQVDRLLLLAQVARRQHPGCTHREAIRRYSRKDVRTFAGSMLGRIVMSAIGDAWTALMTMPEVYRKIAGDSHLMRATRVSEGVDLHLGRLSGPFSAQLGQFEGAAAHYGVALRTRVRVYATTAHFECRPQ